MAVEYESDIVRVEDSNGKIVVFTQDCLVEQGTSSNWDIKDNDGVSDTAHDSRFLKPSAYTWAKETSAKFSFDFIIASTGTFNLYFEVETDNYTSYLWVDLDGLGNVFTNSKLGYLIFQTGYSFEWWKGGDSLITLTAGRHKFSFTSVDSNLKIKSVAIVPSATSITEGGTSIGAYDERFENFTDGGVKYPLAGSTVSKNDVANLDRFTTFGNGVTNLTSARLIISNNLGTWHNQVRPLGGGFTDSTIFAVSTLPNTDGPMTVQLELERNNDNVYNLVHEYTIYSSNPLSFYNYNDWVNDPTKNKDRVLLLEMDHEQGTVRLASQPYLSDEHQAYDDWLISDPFIENSLLAEVSIGDIEAVNLDLDANWRKYNWRGHRCRWYYGDVNWPISKFKKIVSSTIESCSYIGDSKYRFNLVSDRERYNKTFYSGADVTNTHSLHDAISWVMDEGGFVDRFRYIGMSSASLDVSVTYTVTESSNMLNLLERLVAGINANLRFTEVGFLEIVGEVEVVATLTSDSIIDNTISVVETLPAPKRLTVIYGAGDDRITETASESTGTYDEEVVIETHLETLAIAQSFLGTILDQYSENKDVWEMGTILTDNLIQVGDKCTIVHGEIIGTGIVQRIKKTNLSEVTTIEILI